MGKCENVGDQTLIYDARLGKVGLGAGNKFTLDMYGDELIVFTGDALGPTNDNKDREGAVHNIVT